ncbi:hypothetical protein EVAR_80598_1 [Eumeta japonica]|uniref:PiggyBac transposable element-derived protein domain-containing protein n=1 Tax=Eumeta variegata TaxID=151549 RepID=A0A4C1TNR1_EUMVA|nr:hypothetical protein EVAR_80598_1 [Eumeta japonica]
MVKTKRRRAVLKPTAIIVDYNGGKSYIDMSNQMASYGSVLRRCTKWYRKLMIELVWGRITVNAYFLYSKYSQKPKTITIFREKVIDAMLIKYATIPEPRPTPAPRITRHLLVNNLIGTPLKLNKGRLIDRKYLIENTNK